MNRMDGHLFRLGITLTLMTSILSAPALAQQAPEEEAAASEASEAPPAGAVEEPSPAVSEEAPKTDEAVSGATEAPAFIPIAPDDSAANAADRGDLVVLDGGMAQVALYGLVNAQAAVYTGGDNLLQNGDVAEQPGFRLRHGRLGLRGWAFGELSFMVSMETADMDVRPLDAWLAYRPFEALGIVVGAHKVPFSRYATTGAAYGSLAERPMSVDAMAPFRQMGLTLEGTIGEGMARYAVGVYNGLDRHSNFHDGYVENAVYEGNRFDQISVAGRLSLEPFGAVGKEIADLDGGGLRLGVGTSVLHNEGATTRTTAWAADLVIKVHGFHLIAEYLSDLSQPTEDPTSPSTIPAEAERFGVVADMGYMVLPGQLGLSVRGELYDDDMAMDNNGDQVVITGGIQYYWHRHHFKVSIDFTHREELYGFALDNDSLILSAHFAL